MDLSKSFNFSKETPDALTTIPMGATWVGKVFINLEIHYRSMRIFVQCDVGDQAANALYKLVLFLFLIKCHRFKLTVHFS